MALFPHSLPAAGLAGQAPMRRAVVQPAAQVPADDFLPQSWSTPTPLSTLVVTLIFAVLLGWLFFKSRRRERRKEETRRVAN